MSNLNAANKKRWASWAVVVAAGLAVNFLVGQNWARQAPRRHLMMLLEENPQAALLVATPDLGVFGGELRYQLTFEDGTAKVVAFTRRVYLAPEVASETWIYTLRQGRSVD